MDATTDFLIVKNSSQRRLASRKSIEPFSQHCSSSTLTDNMPNFMDLPREVRATIYEHCLVVRDPIAPYAENHWLSPADLAFRKQMPTVALLAVNKTIEFEAAAILYGKNVWRITAKPAFIPYQNDDSLWFRRAQLFKSIVIVFDRNDFESTEWFETVRRREHQNADRPSKTDVFNMHNAAENILWQTWQSKLGFMWAVSDFASAVFDVNRLNCPTYYYRRRMLRLLLEILDAQVAAHRRLNLPHLPRRSHLEVCTCQRKRI